MVPLGLGQHPCGFCLTPYDASRPEQVFAQERWWCSVFCFKAGIARLERS